MSVAPVVRVAVAGVTSAVLVAAVAVAVPRLAESVARPDEDLACVTDWVDASDRVGAGQFWTVRAPKSRVDDPRSLVQVDHRLRGYAWLVNRDDFAVGAVSFLVTDDQSPAFALPDGWAVDAATPVACGRYTILDFGPEAQLPLGPLRS